MLFISKVELKNVPKLHPTKFFSHLRGNLSVLIGIV